MANKYIHFKGSLNVDGTEQVSIPLLVQETVDGNVLGTSASMAGGATEATLAAQNALIGAVNEATPVLDTDPSGLNGGLKRLAERLSSILAKLPASLGAKLAAASLSIVQASDDVFVVEQKKATQVTDFADQVITANGTSTVVYYPDGCMGFACYVDVSAVSGTDPKLDIYIQETRDNGATYETVLYYPRITAVGQVRLPATSPRGVGYRYGWVVAGTTPSFTVTLSKMVLPTPQLLRKQYFDRSIAHNTLGGTSTAWIVNGTSNLQLIISMLAGGTTAPVIELEISTDWGQTYFTVGTAITATASTTKSIVVSGYRATHARTKVTTAGVGAVINYMQIIAWD